MNLEKKDISELIQLIKYPLLTEKSTELYKKNQYTYIVDKRLSKPQIKHILELLFNIKILSINTLVEPIKKKKKGKITGTYPIYKKVFIKIQPIDATSILEI